MRPDCGVAPANVGVRQAGGDTHAVAVLPPGRSPPGEAYGESGFQVLGDTALFVVHGMGQQTPFDSISQVVTGFQALGAWGATAQTVTIGQSSLGMVSMRLPRPPASNSVPNAHAQDTAASSGLHIFEGYWAALTEGVATLRDVGRFLFRGGLAGLKRQGKFRRWLFGQSVEFAVPAWTTVHLVGALLVIIALVVLNALVGLGHAKRLLTAAAPVPGSDTLIRIAVFPLVSGLLLLGSIAVSKAYRSTSVARVLPLAFFPGFILLVILAAAVAALSVDAGGCALEGPRYCVSTLRTYLEGTREDFLSLAVATTIAGPFSLLAMAFAVSWVSFKKRRGSASEPHRKTKSFDVAQCLTTLTGLAAVGGLGYCVWLAGGLTTPNAVAGQPWPAWWINVVWAALLAVSWMVRKLLVRYVGDVAIYVSSYSLDRFYETRSRIRETVASTLRQVYALTVDGKPVYRNVIVAGHSLGSVIAYDVLNQLIAEDAAAATSSDRLDITRRTPLLLTFGSPLDKTAYFFARQAAEVSNARDALGATRQPMLVDKSFRPRCWINVWSPWDIVSGPLEYYEPPIGRDGTPVGVPRVTNLPDAEATTLLAAHIEYWDNRLIYSLIADAVHRASDGELVSAVQEAEKHSPTNRNGG